MNSKILTPSQFFNRWARTGNDPDGNNIKNFVSGGNNDSYRNWLKKQSGLPETKDMENNESETEGSTKYKWVSESDGCSKCKQLDGRIFDEEPDVEEVAHPNCKCEVVEIGDEEAEELINEHEESLSKKDKTLDKLDEGTKFDKEGNYKDKSKSIGLCGRYVGNAIQESFPDYEIGDGKNSGKSLEYVGFMKITDGKNYDSQKGDIKIYQPYEAFDNDGKHYNASHKAGHIQMFDGKQRISDFKQGETPRSIDNNDGGMYPNAGYENSDTQSQIYRHPKWVEWSN